MYPLNVIKPAVGFHQAGFAVANDEAEHAALSGQGYEPKYVAPVAEKAPETKEEVMAALDEAGIEYDKRSGIDKLKALLPQ